MSIFAGSKGVAAGAAVDPVAATADADAESCASDAADALAARLATKPSIARRNFVATTAADADAVVHDLRDGRVGVAPLRRRTVRCG
jgi:hypothetical protein